MFGYHFRDMVRRLPELKDDTQLIPDIRKVLDYLITAKTLAYESSISVKTGLSEERVTDCLYFLGEMAAPIRQDKKGRVLIPEQSLENAKQFSHEKIPSGVESFIFDLEFCWSEYYDENI